MYSSFSHIPTSQLRPSRMNKSIYKHYFDTDQNVARLHSDRSECVDLTPHPTQYRSLWRQIYLWRLVHLLLSNGWPATNNPLGVGLASWDCNGFNPSHWTVECHFGQVVTNQHNLRGGESADVPKLGNWPYFWRRTGHASAEFVVYTTYGIKGQRQEDEDPRQWSHGQLQLDHFTQRETLWS